MTDAYVLIRSDIGAEEAIIKEIEQIQEVKGVYQIYGVYDIIVRVETGTLEELKELIEHKIREIRYVLSTVTMIIIDNNIILS